MTIALTEFVRKDRCFVGIALIDRRVVGWLVNGEPRSFRVEPGEHMVTVYLANSARIPMISARSVSERIVLQPCETVRIVCGRTNHTSESAQLFSRAQSRLWVALSLVALIGGGILAAGLTWLLCPFLREGVAFVALGLGMREPWLSICYLPFSDRVLAAWLGFDFWMLVVSFVVIARVRRHVPGSDSRDTELYFLAKQPITAAERLADCDQTVDGAV